jgi:hypothetical protein
LQLTHEEEEHDQQEDHGDPRDEDAAPQTVLIVGDVLDLDAVLDQVLVDFIT